MNVSREAGRRRNTDHSWNKVVAVFVYRPTYELISTIIRLLETHPAPINVSGALVGIRMENVVVVAVGLQAGNDDAHWYIHNGHAVGPGPAWMQELDEIPS